MARINHAHERPQVPSPPLSRCVREERDSVLREGASLNLYSRLYSPVLHNEIQPAVAHRYLRFHALGTWKEYLPDDFLGYGAVVGRVHQNPPVIVSGGDEVPGRFPPLFIRPFHKHLVPFVEQFFQAAGVVDMHPFLPSCDVHNTEKPVWPGYESSLCVMGNLGHHAGLHAPAFARRS